MAYSYSSMSKQGVDGRRCNRTKARTLRGGNLSSTVDVAAIEARANANVADVTQRRRNQYARVLASLNQE